METKVCGKCKEDKPVSEFHKSKRDGYRSRCKLCHAEDRKEYAKTGYYRRYNKEYEQRPEVKERRKLTKAEYTSRPNVRIKNLARWYTNHEIRAGRVKREPCAMCDRGQGEAHHLDYDAPLVIVWLCEDCHREVHNNLKEKP